MSENLTMVEAQNNGFPFQAYIFPPRITKILHDYFNQFQIPLTISHRFNMPLFSMFTMRIGLMAYFKDPLLLTKNIDPQYKAGKGNVVNIKNKDVFDLYTSVGVPPSTVLSKDALLSKCCGFGVSQEIKNQDDFNQIQLDAYNILKAMYKRNDPEIYLNKLTTYANEYQQLLADDRHEKHEKKKYDAFVPRTNA